MPVEAGVGSFPGRVALVFFGLCTPPVGRGRYGRIPHKKGRGRVRRKKEKYALTAKKLTHILEAKMKKTILFVFMLIILGGCATLRGMGDDFQSLGRGLKQTVSGDQDDTRRR